MSIDNVQATVLRNSLSDVLDAMKQKDVMLIRRHSDVDVALVNIDLLEDLLEMHDKNYVNSIKEARAQAKEGKVSTFDEVFGSI